MLESVGLVRSQLLGRMHHHHVAKHFGGQLHAETPCSRSRQTSGIHDERPHTPEFWRLRLRPVQRAVYGVAVCGASVVSINLSSALGLNGLVRIFTKPKRTLSPSAISRAFAVSRIIGSSAVAGLRRTRSISSQPF